MKNIHIRKAWSLVLSLVMILTMLPFGSYAQGATETPEEAVTTTLEYYQSVKNKNLASFWDTLAVYGAGDDLRDGTWLLPVLEPEGDSSASEYAGAILNELAKGGCPESWLSDLADQQNGEGSFAGGTNSHIFAMIALDAGNGSYDRLSALDWLARQQFDNGGFSWGAGVEPDVDITGMALIALGRYLGTGTTDAERDLAEPAVVAALEFLKDKQISSGGFAGAYGNNANTDAAAVLGLAAVGEDVQSAGWTTDAGENPFSCLLGYRASDRGFGWDDNAVSNAMATAQVLLALDDIAGRESTFNRLSEQEFDDIYIYFTGDPVEAETGAVLSWRLMGTNLDAAGIPTPVEGAHYTVSANDGQEEVVPVGSDNGYVTVTFNEAGTYVLQAEASLDEGVEIAALTIVVQGSSCPADTIQVAIRVEGAYDTTAQADSFTVTDDGDLSPAEVVAQFLESKQITYVMANYNGTGYISEINGEKSGIFGGYDGWLGAVNGDLNTYTVNDGDEVLFFYGDWPSGYAPSTYIPIIAAGTANYELGQDLDIHLTADYNETEYDENWNPISTQVITIDLPDVDVAVNDWAGKTDANGLITIPAEAFSTGNQKIYFSQENENTSPGIVRTVVDIKPVSPGGDIESDGITLVVEGVDGEIIFSESQDWHDGDTALSILLDQPALDVETTGSTGNRYVKSINGLAEFDYGPTSGWTYRVDGDAPSVAADAYELSEGQTVEWVYTAKGLTNYTSDGIKVIVEGLNGEIFFSETLERQEDDTALSIMLDQSELDVITTGSAGNRHVKSINGLAQFDYGPTSRWNYWVDGEAPSVAADAYELSGGQTVKWLYTTENKGTLVTYGQAEVERMLAEIVKQMRLQGIQDEFDIIILARNNALDISSASAFLIDRVRAANGNFSKATDLAKILMAAQACGMNPDNVGGFNLLTSLYQFNNITRQGVNGSIFALLAYDALGVDPSVGSINTREKMIADILSFQNKNGGLALARGGVSDPDLTAMALTALSKYRDQAVVKTAIAQGLSYLSSIQENDGTMPAASLNCSETLSQVIIALASLNIGLDDKRFVRGEGDLLTALLSFKTAEGFKHIQGGTADAMATRQAALALTAYQAYLTWQPGLFDLSSPTAAFSDLYNVKWAQEAISYLSRQNILSGYGDGSFRPLEEVSREQLITMLMRSLEPGFEAAESSFTDVPGQAWFAPYVGAAQKAGITRGIGGGLFGTGTSIRRQDMAVMADKMALRAGIPLGTRGDIASPTFVDAATISDYAVSSIDRLRIAGIIAGKADGRFDPIGSCTRAEAAVIIYGLIKR
ncbi:MAG: DUF4430 domain-containing protein [Syntrophomonas sp.]|nr:DUF4430 domain-containing protein [Syntrophomonas sp.]